jgi:putative FmdB family regulatory protein
MPIYEYRCANCGHELEKLQKISDPPLVDCPACGQAALQKLVSAAGFRLKGGGWYETDFKKDKKKNIVKDDAGKSDKSGAGAKSDKSDKSDQPAGGADKKSSGSSEKAG